MVISSISSFAHFHTAMFLVCNADFMGKSSLYLHTKKLHPDQDKTACARTLPYSQKNSDQLSQDVLLEQAIQSLGVPSDVMLNLPEEPPLSLLENDNFSTVNLNDLQ